MTKKKEQSSIQEQKPKTVETPHELATGIENENLRVLARPFHVGKQYQTGSLVIVSDKPMPEINAHDRACVLNSGIVSTLDLSGVTKPYVPETPDEDPEIKVPETVKN
jgi:hypothetical protein